MPVNHTLLVVRTALVLFLSTLALGLVVGADLHSPVKKVQQQKSGTTTPPRKEEEEDPLPAKSGDTKKPGKRKEVEDDPPAVTSPEVLRFDDPENKQPKATDRTANIDLFRAAKSTKHPGVRNLFLGLAVPYDQIVLKSYKGVTINGKKLGGKFRVEPISIYVEKPGTLKSPITCQIINEEGSREGEEAIAPVSIDRISYYERNAISEVKTFLEVSYTKYETTDPLFLGRYDQLLAGEQVLSYVLRFHQSARQRGVRKGEDWSVVEGELQSQLLEVLMGQLDLLAEAKSWEPAFTLIHRMIETFPTGKDRARIATVLPGLLRTALKDPNFTQDRLVEIRRQLRLLESTFPDSDVAQPIRESLHKQAKLFFDRAKELYKQDKKAEAVGYLKRAEESWPDLPGLRAYAMELRGSYQLLRVGMREQPRYLSPAWAHTDSERRAVELLFEGLVCPVPTVKGIVYYRSELAEGRPRVIDLGRQFNLPRQARWSDGKPITISDLHFTMEQLHKGKGTGRSAAWGELLSRVQTEGNPYRIKVRLHQGFLDPFAAMSFKIIPARSRPDPDSEKFALNPIGSGPFVFAGRKSDPASRREYSAFTVNPHYSAREERRGLPRLSEVRIFASSDPAKEMHDDQVDLALDLSADQMLAIQKLPGVSVSSPAKNNRRIYFLAVNHRKPVLRDADMRIALARAINREQILDDYFRKGLQRKYHKAINGPYPAGTWACNPALVNRDDSDSLDPHDAALARTKASLALKKVAMRDLTLTLKYPTGDPVLAEAMKELCEKVTKVLGTVKLTPQAVTPHDLRREVEQSQSYELAYYHYDFPDQMYWLYPLIGGSGRDGAENYLGYTGSLVARVQGAATLRNIQQIKEEAHRIHRQFLESDMPLIPLWQLDPLYAYRQGRIEWPEVDPWLIFTGVESWQVR